MLTEISPKFESRFFDQEADYELVCQWWKEQNWPPAPKEFLHQGLMITLGSQPIAAGFIFQTDSPMAILEWIIANPKVPFEVRGAALDALIEDLCFVAKKLGFSKVFTMTKHKRLIEREVEHGFLKTDEGVTHLIREL